MDIAFEQQVRERAYHIWMAAGMGDGMAIDHWCAAEKDLTAKPVKPMAKVARVKVPKANPAKAASAKANIKGKAPKAKPATAAAPIN